MSNKAKKHPKYYAVKAYQILASATDEEMAQMLDMTVRTYNDKIIGFYDFNLSEAEKMSQRLHHSIDEIFLTKNV